MAMNRYAVNKWNNNKGHLRNALMELSKEQKQELYYDDLMELCVKHILNVNTDKWEQYCENVTRVSTGGYSGSILYVIMPKEDEGIERALISYADYGSCSICDSLERIHLSDEKEEKVTDDLMALCKDLVCNIVKPYNEGWRYDEQFATIQEEDII